MRTRNWLATIAACLVAVRWGGEATAQDIARPRGNEEIPAADYRSWSLFLICSPGWLAANRSADLADLYRRFEAFGEAIGDDHLAVWFWKEDVAIGGEASAANVDIRRAAKYCQALRLAPSKGPYVVVTNKYPDLMDFPDRTVYTLGVLDSTALGDVLDRLTDGLLLGGGVLPVAAGGGGGSGDSEVGFWIRFLEGAQGALDVPCGVTVAVDTGVFSAELRSCPQ